MTLSPTLVIVATVLLTAVAVHTDTSLTGPCWDHVMRTDELRQLYTGGNPVALRVAPVPAALEGLTTTIVHRVVEVKLRSYGLYHPEARQWIDINLNVGGGQFAMILSLRRWIDNLGYGLPGEITVWGVGGGGQHRGSAGWVLAKVAQHLDDFVALYQRAQRACTM